MTADTKAQLIQDSLRLVDPIASQSHTAHQTDPVFIQHSSQLAYILETELSKFIYDFSLAIYDLTEKHDSSDEKFVLYNIPNDINNIVGVFDKSNIPSVQSILSSENVESQYPFSLLTNSKTLQLPKIEDDDRSIVYVSKDPEVGLWSAPFKDLILHLLALRVTPITTNNRKLQQWEITTLRRRLEAQALSIKNSQVYVAYKPRPAQIAKTGRPDGAN